MKFSIIKKLLICTPALAAVPAIVVPAVQTTQNTKTTNTNKIATTATNDQTQGSITYDILPTKKHGLSCGDDRRYWQYLYWDRVEQGSNPSFEQVRWCEPNRLLIRTEGHSNDERFAYQQIRVNVNVPANTKDFKVSFQGEVYEWFHWNAYVFGSRYQSAVQMFDLGDDVNAHPDRFNNYAINKNDVDPRSIMEHGWNEVGGGSRERTDICSSRTLNWTFNNDTNAPKTFSKYIGISYWVGGQSSWKNGKVKGDIKVGLRTSIDTTGEIAHSLQQWGDIRVECRLTNNDSTCHINKYVDGKGTLIIPDHVTYLGKDYYVREIPSNWSNGSNNIRGLKFASDVKHLKKISYLSFWNTNCLDYYIDHKDELLVFPEGLEEIGCAAFSGTDLGFGKIRGYSFPSTLKKIGKYAFKCSPWIDGNNKNGEMHFKSLPEFGHAVWASASLGCNNCKYIYASTMEIANKVIDYCKNAVYVWWHHEFNTSKEYLLPRLITTNN